MKILLYSDHINDRKLIFHYIGPELQNKYNLTNGGEDCFEMCNGEHGPCEFCGGGLCCRKGLAGNGCDAHAGKTFHHTCVLPCNNSRMF